MYCWAPPLTATLVPVTRSTTDTLCVMPSAAAAATAPTTASWTGLLAAAGAAALSPAQATRANRLTTSILAVTRLTSISPRCHIQAPTPQTARSWSGPGGLLVGAFGSGGRRVGRCLSVRAGVGQELAQRHQAGPD